MPFINTFEEIAMEREVAENIETILEIRFPAAASELISEIRQIHDYVELKKIHRGAITASSPDELRKLWANGLDSEPSHE